MANALLDNVQKLKGKVPDISGGGGKIKKIRNCYFICSCCIFSIFGYVRKE